MTYYLLFFISSALSALYNKKLGWIIIVILIIILSLFAGTRLETVGADYGIYDNYFTRAVQDTTSKYFINYTSTELCVYIIPNLTHFFYYNQKDYINFSFLIFAFLGVFTKLKAIEKSQYFFLGFFLYVSNLFLLQEMTTIRAGVASGIFLLSIKHLVDKNDKKFFILMGFAFLFHYSSILFIVIWVLLKFKNVNYKKYLIALGVSIALAFTKINLLTLLFLDRIFTKVKTYLDILQKQGGEEINIFNFRIIIAFLIVILFYFNLKKFKDNPVFDVLFKIHIISLIVFFALSPTAITFSLRSFELISVIQILLYPMILRIFQPKFKYIGVFIILAIGVFQFYYLIEISDIFKAYKSWLM